MEHSNAIIHSSLKYIPRLNLPDTKYIDSPLRSEKTENQNNDIPTSIFSNQQKNITTSTSYTIFYVYSYLFTEIFLPPKSAQNTSSLSTLSPLPTKFTLQLDQDTKIGKNSHLKYEN